MKRFLIFILLYCGFLELHSEEELISVTEESLPRLPAPPSKEDPILIKHLKGIILLGPTTPLLEESELPSIICGIKIKGVQLPGNPEELKDQLADFLYEEVTAQTIYEIKSTIYDFYKANGHPLAIAETPEQEVTSGVLQLRIYETRLGKIGVEGNRWSSGEQLKEYVSLRPDEAIDENRLIQNVSFMNRNPFRRVDIVYAPGANPETTDVILAVKDRRPIRVYAGAENTGVEPVGRGRWYTGFNWGNIFGLDHVLSYQFTSSYNVHRFHAHTAEYLALLSWKHVLDIYGGYSKVHPKVHSPFKRNDGWSMQVSGRYTVPLKIYRHLEHEISAGGDFKRTNNTFEFTEDFPVIGNNVNLTQLVLGYSGNYERNTYRLDFDGTVYWSPGRWIADQTNQDYESLRPGAKNHWVYFRGSFVYLQRLPKEFSLSVLARGQVSSEPLLPSEQFGLGGYDTVRGYDQREVNKDDAILLSVEGRTPAFPVLHHIKGNWKAVDALQFLAFIDYGWGIDIDALPVGQKSDYLLGIGPGIRYTIEPYITARLDWGIKLHHKAEFGGGNTMVHFNVTASY